eukprot:6195701-Pleurochrysis_carterae.AAC.1
MASRATAYNVNIRAHKRGQYSRTGAGKRQANSEQAGQHLQLIQKYSNSLDSPCGQKCINKGQCAKPFKLGNIIE